METTATKRYRVAHLTDIDPVPCPCGSTRRAFAESTDGTASIHLVEIREDAKTHYHKKLTEIYLILEGSGEMKIVNIPIPAFDPHDEWFD
jgi:mannose-6-phosphate isomerase-like protein (cupin superfamily)